MKTVYAFKLSYIFVKLSVDDNLSAVSSEGRVIKFLMTFQAEENKDGVRSAVGVGRNGSGVLRGKYIYIFNVLF